MQFLWYQSFIYSQAFPGLSNAETQNIVKDLLLSLPSYKVLSFQGNKLLQVLLDKAKISLRDDTRSGAPSLKTTRFFLDLTSFVAVEKRVASPADLLRFNCQCLGKMTLSGLPQDDYVYFIQSTAEALSASEDVHRHHPDLINSAQITSLREQVATASASMIQVSKKELFVDIFYNHPPSASCTIHNGFCTVMESMQNNLASLFTRKQSRRLPCCTPDEAVYQRTSEAGWSVPTSLASSLRDIQNHGDRQEGENKHAIDVQKLIRVRHGLLFLFGVCVRRPIFFCLSSSWLQLASQTNLLSWRWIHLTRATARRVSNHKTKRSCIPSRLDQLITRHPDD